MRQQQKHLLTAIFRDQLDKPVQNVTGLNELVTERRMMKAVVTTRAIRRAILLLQNSWPRSAVEANDSSPLLTVRRQLNSLR